MATHGSLAAEYLRHARGRNNCSHACSPSCTLVPKSSRVGIPELATSRCRVFSRRLEQPRVPREGDLLERRALLHLAVLLALALW
eukprot:5446980-Prymnesium_polylepis.1